MSQDSRRLSSAEAWARFRFAAIGPLLAAPPEDGELRQALADLAGTTWTHPITGKPMTFGLSTIERWYYAVRDHHDPMARLARAPRKDAGRFDAVGPRLRELLRGQHAAHPRWTYQLHADNLAALCRRDPELGEAPSYSTVRRYMRSVGLFRRKTRRVQRCDEDTSFVEREVRSFEAEHVGALWHLDFHHGRKKVLTADGRWVTPILLAILDDCSRLCCHAQWYLDEDTEALVHGFCQAIQKRGVPRMLLNDNGGPMISAEFVSGLERLGIVARRTLSRSPYQNGKQETWFGRVEGRLIPMLENVPDLDLRTLNDATAVWIEEDYNRKVDQATFGLYFRSVTEVSP
ncbi:MAG: IS481 family transposase, partial [Myxococcota bacterium]